MKVGKTTGYAFLALLGVSFVVGVFIFDGRYGEARYQEATSRFQLVGTLRRSALQTYFDTARAEVAAWSLSERIRRSLVQLQTGWDELGVDAAADIRRLYSLEDSTSDALVDDDGSTGIDATYRRAHRELHPFAREFVTGRGYYDFFLIDPDGNIIYTVEKEQDFGSNLLDGPYRESGLANAFRTAIDNDRAGDVVISDLARYAPSNNAPAIFAATAIRAEAGELLGVLALQLPDDTIGRIMRFTAGMGDSGETYLVGEDLLMRSGSRFSEKSTVLEQSVDTETVRLALAGQRGISVTPDYRGIPVLSAYDFIDIDGIRWAVMAEIDAEEVERSVGNFRASLAAAAFAIFSMLLGTFWMLRDAILPDASAFSSDIDIEVDAG